MFRGQSRPANRHRPARQHARQMSAVHMTRLLVTETRGRDTAARAHIRVIDIYPPPDPGQRQPEFDLEWVDGEIYFDLAPNGSHRIRVCEEVRDDAGERANFFCLIPGLEPGATVRFTLEPHANGRLSGNPQSFTADWGDEDANYPAVSEA